MPAPEINSCLLGNAIGPLGIKCPVESSQARNGQQRLEFLYGPGCGTLVVVVDVDEDVVVALAQVANHFHLFGQFAVLRLDNPVPTVAGTLFHLFPVAAV